MNKKRVLIISLFVLLFNFIMCNFAFANPIDIFDYDSYDYYDSEVSFYDHSFFYTLIVAILLVIGISIVFLYFIYKKNKDDSEKEKEDTNK